ncbi:hypothetical protein WSK_1184 [Novosphingobium sp. Rr 2-17]|uniref:hypothetical protein n=1 Tax=Novosphingobium sp. Rr 2-17 TaxID=555793 RepID=UPI000269A7DE|nr:hypothetical protein [Novosphingobium sp. Rr 2-17]EIZ80151.1 hypothetical protein WSK_1184 [Novosphingobium sp. Rr 2-17]
MRTVLVLVATSLALVGCKREPDFAERYDAASSQIKQTAKEIDAQVSGAPPSEDAEGGAAGAR